MGDATSYLIQIPLVLKTGSGQGPLNPFLVHAESKDQSKSSSLEFLKHQSVVRQATEKKKLKCGACSLSCFLFLNFKMLSFVGIKT